MIAPQSVCAMSAIEVATATEAMERRSLEASSQHWRRAIESHSGIESHPWVYDGRPVLRDTRIPISIVIGYLTLGPGREQLRQDYPDLKDDQIKEAVDFALSLLEG